MFGDIVTPLFQFICYIIISFITLPLFNYLLMSLDHFSSAMKIQKETASLSLSCCKKENEKTFKFCPP